MMSFAHGHLFLVPVWLPFNGLSTRITFQWTWSGLSNSNFPLSPSSCRVCWPSLSLLHHPPIRTSPALHCLLLQTAKDVPSKATRDPLLINPGGPWPHLYWLHCGTGPCGAVGHLLQAPPYRSAVTLGHSFHLAQPASPTSRGECKCLQVKSLLQSGVSSRASPQEFALQLPAACWE